MCRSHWAIWGYSWFTRLVMPLVLWRAWWRGRREPLYRHNLWQRLGFAYPEIKAEAPVIWLHAVSLGETRAAAKLIQQIHATYPDARLLLTHFTATGFAEGVTYLREGDLHVWAPWDSPAVVRRFLDRFKPRIALLMETEVWPNWMRALNHRDIPVLLVNGRLSERSMHKALKVAALAQPAFAAFTHVLAQSESDAERFKVVGAGDTWVTGNLKFDLALNPSLLDMGRAWRRRLQKPVVIFASTREGEEQLWLNTWQRLHAQGLADHVHWLLVPRHPDRFEAVCELIEASGLVVSRRSAWQVDGPGAADCSADVWVGNSVGEMHLYFGMSDVTLMGGSFGPFGSQNFIEAVACGCPVVVGPSTFNFSDAAQRLMTAGCLVQSRDMSEAAGIALDWVKRPALLDSMRRAGQAEMAQQRGATQRTMDLIASSLTPEGSGTAPL